MSFASGLLSRPHAILSATAVVVVLGVMSFWNIPTNLFPSTNRPTIAVVTQWPGAMSVDVANDVTHPMEVRLTAIDGVRRVTSTSRDGVSSVQVEFEYGNDINTAANMVSTELSRIRGLLPDGVREPLIFKITDASAPVMVLAVRPAVGSGLDLAQVRRIAENALRDEFLNLPGVAEAEVFGGPVRQVSVEADRDRLQAHGLSLAQLVAAIASSNISRPAGIVRQHGRRYLLTAQSLAETPADVAEILIPIPGGRHVRVGDVASVRWGEADATSLYRGNGREAVAISLLHSERGYARPLLESVDAHLDEIRDRFPNLEIEIADTQGRIIDLTVSNMIDSLRDAVIMTLIVILLFLANSRAALVVALSLPVSYLLTFAILYWMDFQFDMVTLSAIIVAVGLLADDVVVVIENIERHMREMGEDGKRAAVRALDEILLADTSGTVSTILVLVPIMFVGGFVEKVLQPLAMTLSVALFSSLVVSVSLIPLLAPMMLRPGARDPLAWILDGFERRVTEPLRLFYIRLVDWSLEHRAMVSVFFLALFLVSGSQMFKQGRELLPLMDTGVDRISFQAAPDTGDEAMHRLAGQVEAAIRAEVPASWIISMSTVVGAEAGVKSFGAQRLFQQGEITLNLIDRFHRDRSIYDINQGIRRRLLEIPGLVSSSVSVFGATPLSSIAANVDVMVSGPDPMVLDSIADDIMRRLRDVHGLSGMERSWLSGSKRIRLNIDPALARQYGLSPEDVAKQVAMAVGGVEAGRLRIAGESSIPVLVRLRADQRADEESIRAIGIRTPSGAIVPLAAIASPGVVTAPTAETRQYLEPTINVRAWRRNVALTALHDEVEKALEGLSLPRGYELHYEGEYKQLSETFGRLIRALVLGLLMLYLMLAVTFRSFLDPLAIMATLPLAAIGAAFGVILGEKFMSMAAIMGLILLMGIVVNNGILLIDFARRAMAEGASSREALLAAVDKRVRPILMTAISSAVGMIPLAMEWAVGIERLSPLAFVAIGGLITGTFLTMVAVPVLYSALDEARRRLAGRRG